MCILDNPLRFLEPRFAYEMWDVLICALYCVGPDKPSVIINPAEYKDLKIDALITKAIVIATNSAVVNR